MAIAVGVELAPPDVKNLFAGITGTLASGFTQPLAESGKVLYSSIADNFNAGGRPTTWDPLSPATLALRSLDGISGDEPLKATGALERSITQSAAPGSLYHLFSGSLEIGSELIYAHLQQHGGEVMVKNAQLLAHLITNSDLGAIASVYATGDLNIRVSKGKAYAVFGRSVTIPPRPYAVIQSEDVVAFQGIFAGWLDGIVGKYAVKPSSGSRR